MKNILISKPWSRYIKQNSDLQKAKAYFLLLRINDMTSQSDVQLNHRLNSANIFPGVLLDLRFISKFTFGIAMHKVHAYSESN